MSEIIYQNRIAGVRIAVSRYCGPETTDGTDRTRVQVDLEGHEPLQLSIDEWFALSGACGGLYATMALPGCYTSSCLKAAYIGVPHARRAGCPDPERF